MKNSLETRLGIFVALAVIAAVLILETVGGTVFQRGYHLHGLFSSVQDLKPGNPVKMAGVEVGRVEDIHLDETNNKVLVTMKIKKNIAVRSDSTATIKFTGLLGQNFVDLDFGSPGAPKLDDNAYVTTSEGADFSTVMAKIDKVATGVEKLTKSFTGEKIDNLLGPFTDFLKANQVPLTATIANFRDISTQIAQGKGTVGKLINDPALYNSALLSVSNLQDTATEIRGTVTDARKVVDQVNSGQGTVGKMLKDETLYREAAASMSTLREILQKINQGEGSVGKIVNDRELYNNAKLTLQKLDKATEGLEDQGPLSVMGVLVNSLF